MLRSSLSLAKGRRLAALALGLAMSLSCNGAFAAEKLTYLFPAPDFLPAFAPFHIAKAKGYFSEAGLDVAFQVGKGGADVAKQVALNNADLGGANIDTVMLVRANGLPVKAIAQLGTGALYQITVRRDANVKSIIDLKGKKIGVFSFQDTGFYNLQGALAQVGLTRNDVSIQGVGPAGLVQLMISGDLQAVTAVPETTAAIEAAGIAVDTYPITRFFPGMAQVIVASEDTIAKRPDQLRGFVKAVLQAVKDIEADPEGSAKLYVKLVPQHAGQEAMIADILRRYASLVYRSGETKLFGSLDSERVQQMADFYAKADILPNAAVAKEAFTNDLLAR
jgi:NitT/TauT family transport system substrate-binding protein